MEFPSVGCTLYLLVTSGIRLVRGSTEAIPSYSKELESELRTRLFSDYEIFLRPRKLVNVFVGLNLVTINSLDVKDQILSTSGFFTMEWKDSGLDWSNNATYSSVQFLFSNQKYMWRPAIVIENSVNDLEVFSDEDWLIRIISTGDAFWTPGGIFQTSCDVDITYYPLDTQTCSITLTTWAYTSNEISLNFASIPVTTDDFSQNGEWELLETSTSSETGSKSKHDTNEYSRLYFTLKMKRRPLFHILNTILPVLLMASLIVFVFKLPPESGERVGMSLTVLLAYAVYLTLIADNIPKTSLSTSILSTYLTIILMLSTLSVIFTIVVLDIYFNHDVDEEPSSWVQTLTRVFLVKISMWKGERCCGGRKINPNYSKEHSVASTTNLKLSLDVVSQDRNTKTRIRGHKADPINMKPTVAAVDGEDAMKFYSWKEVALILDRCFMYLFIFLTVMTTVICLGILAWLFFTLKLKRRPLFHILHTILPVLLMASLIVFVFKLPPESGERVGMSLTVLLAYAVYLTLIADNIPKTSLSTSILSTYLTIILMLSTLSVIFTIVVLDIYFNHGDDEEPSSWVQTFTRRFLVKLSMWKGEQCCRRKKINPNYTREHSVASSTLDVEYQDRIARDMKPTETDEDGEGDVKLYSWKEVALILDRCFMYLFIFLTVVSTVIFLGVLVWQ